MVRSFVFGSVFLAASAAIVSCVSTPSLSPLSEEGGVDEAAEAGSANTDGSMDSNAAAPSGDAAMPSPVPLADGAACAAACPMAGGTCNGATCVIACPGSPRCAGPIKCPPGVACSVTCTGTQSCGGIDCGTASSCSVTCNGDQACGPVKGMAATTDVTCTGKDACKDVGCGGAMCTVQCDDIACRPADVKCCATQCTVNGVAGKCG